MYNEIVAVKPRYDFEDDARFRGWMLDLQLKSGVKVTVPAPPSLVFLSPDVSADYIAKGAQEWLARRQRSQAS